MISTIQFEHGETTCAVEPGKFCRWLGVSGFGTRTECLLFSEKLFHEQGWLQRCGSCLKEFPVKEKPE